MSGNKTLIADLPINGHIVHFHIECSSGINSIKVLEEIALWTRDKELELRAKPKLPQVKEQNYSQGF